MNFDRYSPEAAQQLLDDLRAKEHVLWHKWTDDELQVCIQKLEAQVTLRFPLAIVDKKGDPDE